MFIYVVGMLLLASLPLNHVTSFLSDNYVVNIRLDYLGHIVLFLPFLFLVKRAYSIHFFLALLSGLIFAGFCEGLQYLLPYRSFNINDLLANIIGVAIGIILVMGPVWGCLKGKVKGENVKG